MASAEVPAPLLDYLVLVQLIYEHTVVGKASLLHMSLEDRLPFSKAVWPAATGECPFHETETNTKSLWWHHSQALSDTQ